MKAVAQIVHGRGIATVTDAHGATPPGRTSRWGVDDAGQPVCVTTPIAAEDEFAVHFHCLEAALRRDVVVDVEGVPVVLASIAPGVGLSQVVWAGLGGRAPRALLHRTARALVFAGGLAARTGLGAPLVWYGVDGAVVPRRQFGETGLSVRVRVTPRLELASLAPEVVRGVQQHTDEQCVVFGIGVALHALAFGVLPFRRAGDIDAELPILRATLDGPREAVEPGDPLEALIVACTAREREARPALATLAAAIDDAEEGVDLRPIIAGLVPAAWQRALDIAEQLPLVDGQGAPSFMARPFDLTPWQERLRHPLPPGVEAPIPLPGRPTRLPF